MSYRDGEQIDPENDGSFVARGFAPTEEKREEEALLAEVKRMTKEFEYRHSNFGKVGQFNDACGCHREPKPGMPPKDVAKMRYELIREELEEYKTALLVDDVVLVADALADLLYVVYGAAHTHGIDIQPVFDEVHRSNMAKVGPDGKVIRRVDGKILKPEGWTKPDVKGEIEKQIKAAND